MMTYDEWLASSPQERDHLLQEWSAYATLGPSVPLAPDSRIGSDQPDVRGGR